MRYVGVGVGHNILDIECTCLCVYVCVFVCIVCVCVIYCIDVWCRQERPYHDDSTASRLLSEVKHRRAWLVLRWGTTLESQVLFFCYFLQLCTHNPSSLTSTPSYKSLPLLYSFPLPYHITLVSISIWLCKLFLSYCMSTLVCCCHPLL